MKKDIEDLGFEPGDADESTGLWSMVENSYTYKNDSMCVLNRVESMPIEAILMDGFWHKN